MKIVVIILYLIFTICGLVFIKLGGNPGSISVNSGTIGFSVNWISAIGFVFYLVSFLIFTRVVVKFDLSYIMPIVTGIVQIATLVASKIVFKETITVQGLVGAIVVIVGIIIMNLPKTITT